MAMPGTTPINFTDTPARRRVSGVDPNTPLPQPSYTNGTVTINAPTAAQVTISGRIVNVKGRGVARAQVVLTGEDGSIRYASTDSAGNYLFSGIDAGRTYVITVRAKGYQQASQVRTFNADAADVDIILLR